MSAQTRDRIHHVVRELGYVPNVAARSLARGRLGVLGFVFPDLDDPTTESGHETLLYSDEVIRGAERAAHARGHAILIAATHGASGRDLVMSVAGKVDGLAVMARSVSAADARLLAGRVPTVLLAGGRQLAGLDFVAADNAGGARAVTRHLLERHDHRDVAFVAGPAASPDGRARFAGYCDALAAAGLLVPAQPDAHGDFTELGGARAVEELLRSRPSPPRALVVGNDQMAVGAMSALARAGLRVPEDVALTGFDDIQLARHVRPALTTVRQPMRRLGEECVRLLLRRLESPDAGRETVVVPTELVVRASCGCSEEGAG